ncbi:unknown protein [Seminavis robusta]|uniref:Probable zinc-binding domain-containing protein n=1 Tax=Seminavis robusta TaxID=568900 RepID=A0A9N8HD69_9STRA|nr:unknown protein [Seminavis robusta]|eukprot:Sro248_g098251.1  (136) ;mRNA; f:16528-17165
MYCTSRERATMDEDLQCIDCDSTFVFTAGQQHYFEQKGFTPPKRCKECRGKKKELHNNISEGFRNNHVTRIPDGIVKCSWCGNAGHREPYCNWKKQATCKMCGTIGWPSGAGFASGIRTNCVRMACDCDQRKGAN